jgi:hypothetical protein
MALRISPCPFGDPILNCMANLVSSAAVTTSATAFAGIVAQSRSLDAKRPVSEVFQRNLKTMVSRLTKDRTDETVEMLLGSFPGLKDFERLRSFAKLYVANEFRTLRRVPAPSDLDSQGLSRELASRFYEGSFVLGEDEGIVFHSGTALGPFDREKAAALAKRLSAASPTNDAQGHTLDPETNYPTPATLLAPTLD